MRWKRAGQVRWWTPQGRVKVERRRRPDAGDASGRLGEGEPIRVAEAALRIRLSRT
ncbi:hypothetical protein SB749_01975 [Brevibacterium sp. SIMBA_078]|uniref:hypothetical protein n=1 Tax=Brevibacterium sp. SIMBA_078 TaxID=3085816 RepID=UPI00397E7A07